MSNGIVSNGVTASYYELPEGAKELQDIISYKNMNAQMGEIFRANMRYGEVDHSDKLRDINKIIFYAMEEKKRLLKYELGTPLPLLPSPDRGNEVLFHSFPVLLEPLSVDEYIIPSREE